ncbi:hypothetical protein FDP41_011388 [Naegleria fowleri]|uniref:Phospholipase/carboxylesterase/thioesterase domain-containing protein n=1 Tax=Naegleria fowleri TaxID=5763 RepID=A0A6A5C9U9_NAEFO|nr:uncharacterized protein FDP41_011388 [Naegleria fowleri]KAF0982458.1 hypothetical protein FDP41_011388 [Naegleria fowleri]CAG4717881.1 unnamed protein product [Naegleria fowleri]
MFRVNGEHTLEKKKIGQLECTVLSPSSVSGVDSVLIWLPGIGDNHDGFIGILKTLLPENTIAIVPSAPKRAVTMYRGRVTNAWFDVKSHNRIANVEEDIAGMTESKKLLDEIISIQMMSFKSHRIVIGGFSQGGAMSILVASQSPHTLGGIISVSGFVPMRTKFSKASDMVLRQNAQTPFYILHGDDDIIVNYSLIAKRSYDWLEEVKTITNRKIYKHVGHFISEEEKKDLKAILAQLFVKSVDVSEQCPHCNF